MKTVTTYPMVVFFNRNSCASKNFSHKAVLIPTIYYMYTSFPNCVNFLLYSGYLLAQGEFPRENNLLGELIICFLTITFSYCCLSSPNFACKVGLKYFLYDITHNSCCLPGFFCFGLFFKKTQL